MEHDLAQAPLSAYAIKPMTQSDLERAMDWAATEGWNPGLADVESFYAADPTGFLMGWLGDEPIASLSVVKYGDTFGFVGFYIVRPGDRGQGYGWALWQVGMNTLRGRIIGLDGVLEQQANYAKSGFQLAYRNIRYEGRERRSLFSQLSMVSPLSTPATPPEAALRSLSQIPIGAIIDYDAAFFPDDRTAFLKQWVAQPRSYGLGLVQKTTLIGYGVLRPCRTGYKIGPLFADTPEGAETIFLGLLQQVEGDRPFYLDVPEVNSNAIALARRYGMQPMFETARMYAPTIPELPMDRIFGVTTFELG